MLATDTIIGLERFSSGLNRHGILKWREIYAYDALDRLTTATNTSNAALSQSFTTSIDGNILMATGIGNGGVGTPTNTMVCNTQYQEGITRIAMPTTVTSKGQVTIPKPIRDRLGIKPGTRVAFSLDKDGRAFILAEGAERPLTSRFEHLRGTATTRLSTDEIMALTRGDAA